MRNIFVTTVVCLLYIHQLSAQHVCFTKQGEIEFEKKINMHAIYRASMTKQNETYMQKVFDEYKAKHPQFVTVKSTLVFTAQTTFFKPIKTENAAATFAGGHPSVNQINTIKTDLASKTSITQKTVFEELYLVKDSLRKINWKITDETREIAGYPCRRANALIMDSIYVVAFYTDKIPVSGGPESFTGLPGMILGVALPHDHLTWFATAVKDMPVAKAAFPMPTKGKHVDNKTLKATLEGVFKHWGTAAQAYLKFFML